MRHNLSYRGPLKSSNAEVAFVRANFTAGRGHTWREAGLRDRESRHRVCVVVRRNEPDNRNNKPLPHIIISNAERRVLVHRVNWGAIPRGDLVKPVLPATPKRAKAGAESKGLPAETNFY